MSDVAKPSPPAPHPLPSAELPTPAPGETDLLSPEGFREPRIKQRGSSTPTAHADATAGTASWQRKPARLEIPRSPPPAAGTLTAAAAQGPAQENDRTVPSTPLLDASGQQQRLAEGGGRQPQDEGGPAARRGFGLPPALALPFTNALWSLFRFGRSDAAPPSTQTPTKTPGGSSRGWVAKSTSNRRPFPSPTKSPQLPQGGAIWAKLGLSEFGKWEDEMAGGSDGAQGGGGSVRSFVRRYGAWLNVLLVCLLLIALGLGLTLVIARSLSHPASRIVAAPVAPPPPTSPPELVGTAAAQCQGPCCSANSRWLPGSVPTMASTWWSNAMPDGARVQLRALANGLWVSPPEGGDSWQHLGAYAPLAAQGEYLKVVRAGGSGSAAIRLRTPEGFYLGADGEGPLAALHMREDPTTLFSLLPVANSTSHVQLATADGRHVSVRGDGALAQTLQPAHAATFEVREVMTVAAMRGVSLGNWLLVEAWMGPDLFVQVPTLTDGVKFRLMSVATGKYVSASSGSPTAGIYLRPGSAAAAARSSISCNSTTPRDAETFRLRTAEIGNGTAGGVHIRTVDLTFWSVQSPEGGVGTAVRDDAAAPGAEGLETFRLHFDPDHRNVVMLEAPGGGFLRVHGNGQVAADAPADAVSPTRGSHDWWGPSAFYLDQLGGVRGEWQLSATLGTARAQQTLERHYATFITEDDFAYLAEQDVNAVRIPLGYWIAQANPDAPFAGGALPYLDLAFAWAERYGLRVFLSMHAAPGSQNGFEHSASRDGVPSWGAATPGSVDVLVAAVEFLAARYATHPAFLGINLLNAPRADGVPLDVLSGYYERAYAAVRGQSRCAYVALQSRVGASLYELEDFMAKDEFTNVISEVHFHSIFGAVTRDRDALYNAEFARTNRTGQLARLQGGGGAPVRRPALVGEWSLALHEELDASADDVAAFGAAQLASYHHAGAGWFFWTYKMGRPGWPHFSFRAAIERGWLARGAGGSW